MVAQLRVITIGLSRAFDKSDRQVSAKNASALCAGDDDGEEGLGIGGRSVK